MEQKVAIEHHQMQEQHLSKEEQVAQQQNQQQSVMLKQLQVIGQMRKLYNNNNKDQVQLQHQQKHEGAMPASISAISDQQEQQNLNLNAKQNEQRKGKEAQTIVAASPFQQLQLQIAQQLQNKPKQMDSSSFSNRLMRQLQQQSELISIFGFGTFISGRKIVKYFYNFQNRKIFTKNINLWTKNEFLVGKRFVITKLNFIAIRSDSEIYSSNFEYASSFDSDILPYAASCIRFCGHK